MRLRHLHLPNLPTYATATEVQTLLQRQFLSSKDAPSSTPPPPPTLLSFTPTPTYTYGRRQRLPHTFNPSDPSTLPGIHPRLLDPHSNTTLSSPLRLPSGTYTPTIHPSPRGGLTTYHGPGQIVLWPVLDLISPHHKSLGVKDYACLLEKTTISTLDSLLGIKAFTTSDPGVWVGTPGRLRKIAAMGVHLRRHVSSLGVAVNLNMPYIRSEDVEQNPWARIVPCGLAETGVTDVGSEAGGGDLDPGRFADAWAEEFADRFGLEGMEVVSEGDVASVLAKMPPAL